MREIFCTDKKIEILSYCILSQEIDVVSPYGYKRISFFNILYLHKEGKYIEIVYLCPEMNHDIKLFGLYLQGNGLGLTYARKETLLIRCSLSTFCCQFPANFIYAKRNYFVNMIHVIDLTNKMVKMRDLTEIKLPFDRAANMREKWKEYSKNAVDNVAKVPSSLDIY